MFAAAGLMLATPSCKKGENDPFMSLKGRKSRLAGEWKLTAAEWTDTDTYSQGGSSYLEVDKWVYDGTNLTYTFTQSIDGVAQTPPAPVVDTYAMSHTFSKDGSYASSSTTNSNTSTSEGYWSFVGKSKVQELKKKEAVLITETSTLSFGNTNTYTGKSMYPDGYLLLDRLSGKEMIAKIDHSATYSGGDTDVDLGTWTFEKQ